MSDQPYDFRFWLSYAANLALLIATTIQVRYSDFVLHELHGTELQLGWITGLAMIGAVVLRLMMGRVIDRIGAARIWHLGLLVHILGTLSHLWIDQIGISIFFARLATTSATAAIFGASLTHISLRAPLARVAEVIGVLGSSGFLGMAMGPLIVDALLGQDRSSEMISRMFIGSACAGTLSLALAMLATTGASLQWRRPSRRTNFWKLLRRYQPVELLVIGTAMGLGLGLPQVFMRAFVEARQLGQVSTFFLTYATVAFLSRILTRDINARLGTDRVILASMGLLTLTYVLLIPAYSRWALQIPAIVGGFAHALIFPAVVSASTLAFPVRHRGTATTLILTGFDLGNLIGLPLSGSLITLARQLNVSPYTLAFTVVSLLLMISVVHFCWIRRKEQNSRSTCRI